MIAKVNLNLVNLLLVKLTACSKPASRRQQSRQRDGAAVFVPPFSPAVARGAIVLQPRNGLLAVSYAFEAAGMTGDVFINT